MNKKRACLYNCTSESLSEYFDKPLMMNPYSFGYSSSFQSLDYVCLSELSLMTRVALYLFEVQNSRNRIQA